MDHEVKRDESRSTPACKKGKAGSIGWRVREGGCERGEIG